MERNKVKEKRLVLGVTGMPGAGKATASEIVRKLGFDVVVMGDEIRAEAKRRGLSATPENLGKIMLKIRAEEGQGALAKRCIPKIFASKSKRILIDGIRSPEEVEEFRKVFQNFKVIAIHAAPKTRFERLKHRGRSDAPKDWSMFMERDKRELSVGIGEVIATADYMVINDGTKEDLRRNLLKLVEKIITESENI